MEEVVILAARRTAIGKFNGALAGIPAHSLGAKVIKALLDELKLPPEKINEVIMGQVLTAGAGMNPARQASLEAGLPYETTAMVVSKVCGSGLKAIHLAAQSIRCCDADIVIAGGQENMSRAPHVLPNSRHGMKMGKWQLMDTMVNDGLWDVFNDYHMANTAQNVSDQFHISREAQDIFAAASQNKVEAAQKSGRFQEEIIPIEIPQHKKAPLIFDTDEFPRHGTTPESLAKLRPAFDNAEDITAGNASGVNDGAAAVVVASARMAKELGLQPIARIVSCASAGLDPAFMGLGPVAASQLCLKRAGWTVDQLDLIEANEAFAAQSIAVNQQMGWDPNKVNVNGGSIALGHPIGASGARVMATLLHEMIKRDAKKGLATLCIGGGQGIAITVERP
jgi:acetyl-CoA C-acetyltransferase